MQQIDTLINDSQKILIVSHIRPDWDAICSAIATYTYLIKTQPNKKVDMAFSSFPSKQFEGVKYADKILWVDDIAQIIENYDLVIFVDGNEITRFSDTLEFTNITAKTICIDHHPDSCNNYTFKIVEPEESSCSGMIYKHLLQDNKPIIDKDLAETLLTGILSDTGSFNYINYSETSTFTFAKELLEISKSDIQTIQAKLVELDLDDIELIKILLNNFKQVKLEGIPPFSYTYYPLESFTKFGKIKLKATASKFMFNFLFNVKDYVWGFMVTPMSDKEFNISFRSKPEYPEMDKIASTFGGGGHFNSAGGDIAYDKSMTSQEVCEDIIEELLN